MDLVGIDHVCLGLDFYDYLAPYRPDWDADDLPFGGLAAGLDGDPAVADIGPALRDRGFDNDAVAAITHANLVRVLSAVLDGE